MKPGSQAMTVTFLGSGTSTGVPMIGCDCPVCLSDDPRNRRRRSCIQLTAGNLSVVVDTPPEFREQSLAHRLRRVDALLFTHSHADHIFGLDDVRRFNTMQQEIIPAYATEDTRADLRRVFSYIGRRWRQTGGLYRPLVDFKTIDGPFSLRDLLVTPVEVEHGDCCTIGFRFDRGDGSLAYVPDCAAMSDSAVEVLSGVDLLIIDGLRHRPHPTHLTIAASIGLSRRIGARTTFLTHICHDIDHQTEQDRLPPRVFLGYDGLRLEVGEVFVSAPADGRPNRGEEKQ